MNLKIVQAVAGGWLLCACAALQSLVSLPMSCPEPPERFGPAPLILCGLPGGEADTTCCAYGQFESAGGELCFHVLCKHDACGDYSYVDTVCPAPEAKGPTTEVQSYRYRPKEKA